MPFTIGVPRESAPREQRVALVPEVVQRLVKQGFAVVVEAGAGQSAFYPDEAYAAAGARLADRAAAFAADLVTTVQAPSAADAPLLRAGSTLVGLLRPLDDAEGVERLATAGVTALAMELVPRTTRAQKMDALSAMATVAGYRAVLLAAERLPKFFPLLTTAAGTVRPAKLLVLGVGVAGLQAIATARRLGAVVSAYDVRAAAREEAASLGAKVVELGLGSAEGTGGYARALTPEEERQQLQQLVPHVAAADVVITTALVPGRAAPRLVIAEAVAGMAPGSVIVDLAAPNGGNCALTQPGEEVLHRGVRIAGPLNLAAELPLHASQMYARTVAALLGEFSKEGAFTPDPADEIVREMTVTRGGEIVHPRLQRKAVV